MIKYNLKCSECNKNFDSWFLNSSEFDRLKNKKLISCIQCNSSNIEKTIMSPNLPGFKKPSKRNSKDDIGKLKKKILEYQKFIKDNSTYVGNNFAYEARNMFYNEKKLKSIYGKATEEEIIELNEEGIETTTIPWFKEEKN